MLYLNNLYRLLPIIPVYAVLSLLVLSDVSDFFLVAYCCAAAVLPFILCGIIFNNRFTQSGRDFEFSLPIGNRKLYIINILSVLTVSVLSVGFMLAYMLTVGYNAIFMTSLSCMFVSFCCAVSVMPVMKNKLSGVMFGAIIAAAPPVLMWSVNMLINGWLGCYFDFGIGIPVWLYAILPLIAIIFGNRGGGRVCDAVKFVSLTLMTVCLYMLLRYALSSIFGAAVAFAILITVSAIIDRSVRGVIKSLPILAVSAVLCAVFICGIRGYVGYSRSAVIEPEAVESIEYFMYRRDAERYISTDSTLIADFTVSSSNYDDGLCDVHVKYNMKGALPVIRKYYVTGGFMENAKIQGELQK